jgi:hypothetical protein
MEFSETRLELASEKEAIAFPNADDLSCRYHIPDC